MQHSIEKYLEDVRLSILDTARYTADINGYTDIENNPILVDALSRRLAIIGEAIFHANRIDPLLPVTYKKRFIRLRRTILHSYDSVQPWDVWSIISHHLGKLKAEVEDLLNRM